MSGAPAFPKDVSFAARDVILNMTLMESFGDGLYSAIFWFTLYMMVFRKRERGVRLGFSGFFIIIPLYILAMIHLSVRWVTTRRSFVVHGDTSETTLTSYLTQPQWAIATSVISFTLMSLIADFVTVWRCWMIWNRDWKVVLGPLLMVLTGIAFAIMSAAFQIDPSSTLSSDNFNKFAKFSAVYFGLSLGSTTICTTLIVYRIMSVGRDTGFHLESPYRKVIEIIVESAALYSVTLIIYVPFLVRDDFSDGYIQAVLICVTGIAPTIISGRVSLGVSRDYSTVHRTDESSLVIAGNVTMNTEMSRTVNNNSINELSSVEKKEGSYQGSLKFGR